MRDGFRVVPELDADFGENPVRRRLDPHQTLFGENVIGRNIAGDVGRDAVRNFNTPRRHAGIASAARRLGGRRLQIHAHRRAHNLAVGHPKGKHTAINRRRTTVCRAIAPPQPSSCRASSTSMIGMPSRIG